MVALRPKAKVAYYGMINCGGSYDIGAKSCPDHIRERHDALAPLWAAGSALMPSIYSSCDFNGTGAVPRCADSSQLQVNK